MPILDEYRVIPAKVGTGWMFRVSPRGEQPFTVSGFVDFEGAAHAAANHYAGRMVAQSAEALGDPAYARGKQRPTYLEEAQVRFRRA